MRSVDRLYWLISFYFVRTALVKRDAARMFSLSPFPSLHEFTVLRVTVVVVIVKKVDGLPFTFTFNLVKYVRSAAQRNVTWHGAAPLSLHASKPVNLFRRRLLRLFFSLLLHGMDVRSFSVLFTVGRWSVMWYNTARRLFVKTM